VAETLGDLLAGQPISTLSVHLGQSLPVGVPSLLSLRDATFAGYRPAVFSSGYGVEESSGFAILTGNVSFLCIDPAGFNAACLWVVSTATGSPVLIAYTPLPTGAIALSGSGTLLVTVNVSIFEIPTG
jgi:hypothetical protein